jgi:hypothetical protein
MDATLPCKWNHTHKFLRVISLRHADGSFEDLGRVDGDSSYIEMIKRLSSRAAQHAWYILKTKNLPIKYTFHHINLNLWQNSPPYSSMEDMWEDTPRQAWRSLRKKIGLAPSPDVATISNLVKNLLSLTKSPTAPYVVISYPGIAALYKEDINDVAEYLGLPKLTGFYNFHPSEIYASFAGHGLGLCEHFEAKDRCQDEGSQLPMRETFLVEYTDQAILLQTEYLQTALDVDYGSTDPHSIASFELGAHSSVDNHASRVAEFVYRFLSSWYGNVPIGVPDELLIIMTGIMDDGIEEAIRDAAGRVVPNAQMLASKTEFVAARGSAELARRVNVMASS